MNINKVKGFDVSFKFKNKVIHFDSKNITDNTITKLRDAGLTYHQDDMFWGEPDFSKNSCIYSMEDKNFCWGKIQDMYQDDLKEASKNCFEGWVFQNVTSYRGACKFLKGDIKFPSSLYDCSNFDGMFERNYDIRTVDFSDFDFSKVNSFEMLFYSCVSLESVDLAGKIKNNANCKEMLANCANLKTVDLSNCSIREFGNIFNGSNSIEYVNLSGCAIQGNDLINLKKSLPVSAVIDLGDRKEYGEYGRYFSIGTKEVEFKEIDAANPSKELVESLANYGVEIVYRNGYGCAIYPKEKAILGGFIEAMGNDANNWKCSDWTKRADGGDVSDVFYSLESLDLYADVILGKGVFAEMFSNVKPGSLNLNLSNWDITNDTNGFNPNTDATEKESKSTGVMNIFK